VLICVALTSVVAGCISGRARQIYVLSDAVDSPPDNSPDNKAAVGRTELQLERVLVPDYLDTTDIFSRVGEHELRASSSGRWGERLSLGIMRALWADLSDRLPQDKVTLARLAEKSARQILVNVDAFDVWPNGHCVLAANWSILDTDRTVVLATGRGTFIVPPDRSGKPSDGAVVSAMADALRQLAESIALAAKALPPRAGPSSGALFRGSVARPKLLQEVSCRNEVACLEPLRKSVEDRVEKFERFVSLGSISPEFCEADANPQLEGEQSPLPRKPKRLQQESLALTGVLLRPRCEGLALYA
jgi:uncharacterized lipoprotein YmbA